jgi:predicted amidohydrolase YtcJ
MDAHIHLAITGMGSLAVDLDGVDAIPVVLDKIAAEAQRRPVHGLIVAINFQAEINPEGRFPAPLELDQAGGGRPVYVMDRTGHECYINQAAFRLLELDDGVPGINRREDGSFSGKLTNMANTRAFDGFWERFSEEIGFDRAYRIAAQQAVRSGITTVHALDDLDAIRTLLTIREQLPARVIPYAQTRDVAAVKALGLRQIGGCGDVMVDGDFGPHTAALLDPYTDDPSTRGKLYYADDDLAQYVEEAHRAGLQIALHCVGSAAIEQLLNAYERALEIAPRANHRHRIEHFELPAPGQAERARRLGVALSMQPVFNHYWPHEGEYPNLVGWDRAQQVDPLASLVALGLPIGLGSDSPVTPVSPLLWLHSAVHHSNPAERVSVETALRLATQGSAYLAFEETQKGSLEAGKLADFVLLDHDPLTCPAEQIQAIQVLKTVVGGRVVFDRDRGDE